MPEMAPQPLDYQTPTPLVNPALPRWLIILAVGFALVILVAFFVPTIGRSGPPRAYNVQCGTNEHQIISAIVDYSRRNGGTMPASLAALQQPTYSPSLATMLKCPVSGALYLYVGQSVNLATASGNTILLYEPPTNHKDPKTGKGAMYVGYADGSVRLVFQPQADKIIAELKAGHNPPRAEMIR